MNQKIGCDALKQEYEKLKANIANTNNDLVLSEFNNTNFYLESKTGVIDYVSDNKIFDKNKSVKDRLSSYGYYGSITSEGTKAFYSCAAPSNEDNPYKGLNVNQNVTADCNVEPTEESQINKITSNICAPILKEYWGVKFNFEEGGENKMWALSLAPAVKSQANSSVPNAMPGLRIQASTKFAKKEVPGWHSIYQPMGVDTVFITMVGAFTGDGGYRGNASYQPGVFTGRENPRFPIDPTTNPNYNVGNRLLTGVSRFDDNPSVNKLIDEFGVESAVMANFVNREGMFDRVGCDGECPPTYRGLFGDADGAIKYPDFYIGNPGAPGTYTRQELNAYLDAYHEFDDFMRLAVVQGREMDVEINMRKSLDSLRPFDKKWQPNENTLRNATTGNIAFKGVVRTMDVYAARANRVWYTIVMEITDLGISDIASVGADWEYRIYSEEEIENLKEEALTPETVKERCREDLITISNLLSTEMDKFAGRGNVAFNTLLKKEVTSNNELIITIAERKADSLFDIIGGIVGAVGTAGGAAATAILSQAAIGTPLILVSGVVAFILAIIVLCTMGIIYLAEGLGFSNWGAVERELNKKLDENRSALNNLLDIKTDLKNKTVTVTCKN